MATRSVEPRAGAALPSPIRTDRRRELSAATVGSIVEAFDWTMYAALAPFFADAVFPGGGTGSLLVAYAGFAVGFLARPVGSLVLGRVADRRGRKYGLLVGMTLIATAALVIALVPDKAVIGFWSAVIVVVARLLQGLAYGGEGPIIAAYVTETAPPRRRFLFSSISYGGVLVGSMLAFLAVAVLHGIFGEDGLTEGGWRWGFAAAALIGVLALWVRRHAPESEEFERDLAERGTVRPKVGHTLLEHRRAGLALFLITIGGTVNFYFSLIYLPTYATHLGVAEQAEASSFMTVGYLVALGAMLAIGALADRAGLGPVLRVAYVVMTLAWIPLLAALDAELIGFRTVVVVGAILSAAPIAVGNVMGGLMFPTAVRAVGVGVVVGVAVSGFGGTFPLIAEAMASRDLLWLVPGYLTAAGAAGFLGTLIASGVPGFQQASRPTRDGAVR